MRKLDLPQSVVGEWLILGRRLLGLGKQYEDTYLNTETKNVLKLMMTR